MTFNLDPNKPIYQQVAQQILQDIKEGKLRPGDRLPTERELAAQLGVARGTVKKAYRELADNNLVEVIQGSGTYVHSHRQGAEGEKRKLAMTLLEETADRLDLWGFSPEESLNMMRIVLDKASPGEKTLRLAVIDCNPESLAIFKKQLLYLPGVSLSLFMVDSIILDDDPRALLADFDLVVTTETHYDQIAQSLAGFGKKLLKVAMAPSRHTIVSITTLPRETPIGIVCSSNKFANLITEQLCYFREEEKSYPVNFETDLQSTIGFMGRYGAIVVSPDSLLFDKQAAGDALDRYRQQGGRVIPFDYLIERGSLIHLEEQVGALMEEKYHLPETL